MSDTLLRMFLPLRKVDEEKRLVYGVLAEEAVDKAGEIFDYAKSKPHFEAWSNAFKKATDGKSSGNLRVMHTEKVAGHFESIEFDDVAHQVLAVAKVTDDDSWKHVLAGDYTGYSIGGQYANRWQDPVAKARRYEAVPVEGSLCDNPSMYGATFQLLKSDGSEELRKFAKPELQKDAPAAQAAVQQAVDALRTAIAAAADLENTWMIEQLAYALSSVRGLKFDLQWEVADAAMTAAAAPVELVKTEPAPADPAPAGDPPPSDPDEEGKAEAKPEEDPEPVVDPPAAAADPAPSQDVEALKAENATLKKSFATLEERLKKIEDRPAPVGRPVQKTIGDGASHVAGFPNEAAVVIEKAISAAREQGVPEADLGKVRLAVVTELLKSTR